MKLNSLEESMIDVGSGLELESLFQEEEMNEETEELLKELKAYKNDMVARNYPFQQISDIITKWEMKKVTPITYDKHNRDTSNDPFKGTSIEGKD